MNRAGTVQNLKPFKTGYDIRRNVTGRPKNSMSVVLSQYLDEVDSDDTEGRTVREIVAQRLIQEAKKKNPDYRLLELMLHYADGKPVQATHMTSEGPAMLVNIQNNTVYQNDMSDLTDQELIELVQNENPVQDDEVTAETAKSVV